MGQPLFRSKVFHTERLVVRPLAISDVDDLHPLWTTAGVRRFLWDDETIPRERTQSILETSVELFTRNGLGMWGGRARDDGGLVGVAGFWYFRDPPELEFLFAIDERYWLQGFAVELGRVVLDYGFSTLAMPEIKASTDEANGASVRALTKLGFVQTRRAIVGVGGLETIFFALTKLT
jgi:RimJ/RimL family protein N-acetyltransferase